MKVRSDNDGVLILYNLFGYLRSFANHKAMHYFSRV